jgi:hypothetical protein
MSHSIRFIIVVSVLSCTLLDTADAAAAQSMKVRISYSSRSNSVTPFHVALAKGLFGE